jgi:hypothetical protein
MRRRYFATRAEASRKRGAGETNILLPVKMVSKIRGIFSHISSVSELPSLLMCEEKTRCLLPFELNLAGGLCGY